MQMWNKRLLAAAIALSATTGQVYAAETVDADVPAGEEVATHALGETVVTATRTKKRDLDVPAATTIITAQEIKDSGAANASDVLAKANGFIYKSFGPAGAAQGVMTNELNVRGVRSGVLVLMNGNPISWRGKYNLDAIPAESIERIEIVKGSGSVLYGSDAMAGVVNIITKKKMANEVHAGFGNYGQRSYGVSVGDERFGLYYNFDQFGRRDGLYYDEETRKRKVGSVYVPQFKGEQRTDIHDIKQESMGLTYHVNPRLDFLLNYYESEVRYTRTFTHVDFSTAGIMAGAPYNSRKYVTNRYTTQLNYKDRDWKGSLYFNTGASEGTGTTYMNRVGAKKPAEYHTREKNSTFGLDLQRTWRIGGKSTAIAGVKAEHEIYDVTKAEGDSKTGRFVRNNWGVYGQWEQRFDAKNTGIFGLRETWTTGATRGQNYSDLSASAQWLHKLNRDSSVYLNVSQSFVMPTFSQMYPKSDMQLPTPNLKPQKGINYEIGWKKNHGGHTWKAALFHIDIKDNISASVDKDSGTVQYIYVNEDFRNTGVELSNEIRGKNGFSYHWGVTWQNPQTKNSDRPGGWYRNFGKLQLTGGVTYRKDKWTSSLTATYLGSRVVLPSKELPHAVKPYLLTTWNTTYAPDENNEISLRIDNVLDRDDTTMHTGLRYHSAPINYLLSYSYKF